MNQRELLPTTLHIHGEPFDASKGTDGTVTLTQTFGFGKRWFDNEAQFRLWAKPYLKIWH